MPLFRCTKDDKSGWKWGDEGKCFTGSGAKRKAINQGIAIEGPEAVQKILSNKGYIMEIITFNFSGPVRHDQMGGRKYIVAPMVMLTEGVHEGSNGPLFYPESELSKNPEVWNLKPIVLGHPTRNGRGVTACDPDVITGRGVGVVMNTRWDGKLRAEAWFERDRMNKIDSRIEQYLEQNKKMEISTGLYTDNEDVQGEFDGKPYKAIARNHRPDHLALLPDGKGSCSIEGGGCGLLQLNESSELVDVIRSKFGDEEWADGVLELIKNAKHLANVPINDLPDSEFAFILPGGKKDEEGKTVPRSLRKLPIHEAANVRNALARLNQTDLTVTQMRSAFRKILAAAKKFEIEVSPSVKAKFGVTTNRKGAQMSKEERIDALVTNKLTKWIEDDKEFLQTFEDDQLEKLEPVANQKPDPPKDPIEIRFDASKYTADQAKKWLTDNKYKVNELTQNAQHLICRCEPASPTKNEESDPKDGEGFEQKPVTIEKYVSNAPSEIRDMLIAGLNSHNQDRQNLISTITDNEANKFSPEQLAAMSADQLQMIAALAKKPEQESSPLLNFLGAAPAQVASATEEKPLLRPVMNFQTKAS